MKGGEKRGKKIEKRYILLRLSRLKVPSFYDWPRSHAPCPIS